MENQLKGIVQQMRESEFHTWDKPTQKGWEEVLKDLEKRMEVALVEDKKYRKKRLKELENNRKFLNKRAKELNKEIPFEVAYHCFLSYNKTYIGSDFINKYEEWL